MLTPLALQEDKTSFASSSAEALIFAFPIEFSYKGKSYSITKTNKNLISFCEYYKEPKYFNTVDEFMSNAKIDDMLLSNIWESITDLMY